MSNYDPNNQVGGARVKAAGETKCLMSNYDPNNHGQEWSRTSAP
jgi:hypothetical protein